MLDRNLINDPNTSGHTLHQLADQYPDLRDRILAHPNCSPDLAQWIRSQPPVAPKKSPAKAIAITAGVIAVATVVVGLFASGMIGGKNEASPAPSTPTTAASSKTLAPSKTSTSTATMKTGPLTARERGIKLVHSHPAAGGGRPTHAKAATTIIDLGAGAVAIIATPSKNIGCDINKSSEGTTLDCYVQSWTDGHFPVPPKDWDAHDEIDGFPWVSLGTGNEPGYFGGERTDGFCHLPGYCVPGSTPQILNYGTAIYHGDVTCTSEKNGLSCWNTKTGHGVFMSRNHYESY